MNNLDFFCFFCTSDFLKPFYSQNVMGVILSFVFSAKLPIFTRVKPYIFTVKANRIHGRFSSIV